MISQANQASWVRDPTIRLLPQLRNSRIVTENCASCDNFERFVALTSARLNSLELYLSFLNFTRFLREF
jgi:hypothetical protein